MTGGDVTEITYNHPTLGSGSFQVKANEDSTFDPGGYRTDDDDDSVDGGGNMIAKVNRKRWSVEAVLAWDQNGNDEVEILRQLQTDPVETEFTITVINGTVRSGKGKPVGDIKGNANTSTIPVKFAGGGLMKKIVG